MFNLRNLFNQHEEIHQLNLQCDRLLRKCNQLEQELVSKDINIAELSVNLTEEKLQNQELRVDNKNLRNSLDGLRKDNEYLTNIQNQYNQLEMPRPLREIETKMKSADKFTIRVILDYLRLDSFELVKNLAKTTNSGNVAEVIAYRDGALGRNDALIKTLEKYDTTDSFTDRISGKTKNK